MKGSRILINGNEPKGRFVEGTISGTPAPGTFMERVPGVEPVNGRYTYRFAQTGSNGDRRPIIILLEDTEQGVSPSPTGANTYVSGTRGFLYYPAAGDELNALFRNIAGTADAFTIGQKAMIGVADGKLIAGTGATVSQPFEVEETVAALTADQLIAVTFG